MSKQCKHEFGSVNMPDPDGGKKKLKFNFCPACGGFMAIAALTPTQRIGVHAHVEQMRADAKTAARAK